MKIKWLVVGIASLALGAGYGTSAWAHEKDGGAEEAGGEDHEEMPDTVGGIWHEVTEHVEELGGIVARNELGEVHEVAFEIRDYVNGLADHSAGLAADELAQVRESASSVTKLASQLDEAGDSGNREATVDIFARLKEVLKTIESQYPAEMLKYTGEADDDDDGDDHVAAVYTCRMHPEVTASEPGDCPKCGMALHLRK